MLWPVTHTQSSASSLKGCLHFFPPEQLFKTWVILTQFVTPKPNASLNYKQTEKEKLTRNRKPASGTRLWLSGRRIDTFRCFAAHVLFLLCRWRGLITVSSRICCVSTQVQTPDRSRHECLNCIQTYFNSGVSYQKLCFSLLLWRVIVDVWPHLV